jgi:hypothetical protein
VVWLVTLGVVALFFGNALSMRVYYNDWPFFQLIVLVPLIAGAVVYWLLQGRSRAFCGALGIIVALTGMFFNPLVSGLGFLYNSDLAQQIQQIDAADPASQTGQPPMWLEYGSNFPIIPALGGRSLTVTMWYPQYDLWQKLDPGLVHQDTYNRHLYVNLNFTADPSEVDFANPTHSVLGLTISPLNPLLQSVGAKYVLGVGYSQAGLDQTTLVPLYRAPNHGFTIYQISTAPSNQPVAPPDASLSGGMDVYSCSNIAGWVWNAKQPDQPVQVGLYDGDNLVMSWAAAVYRSDLETAGVGNGRHGFAMAVPHSLQDGQPHRLSVRVIGSAYTIPLPGGPAQSAPLTCTGS